MRRAVWSVSLSALFRIFTCIKINDSIVDGFSFFYAEVKRLKALLDALRANDPLPLFFLIDEIFKGTNNRERLVGSRSYIRNLIGKNGAGLIATHDLELIKLADDFPNITNCHFREKVADGKMVFDYNADRRIAGGLTAAARLAKGSR